MYPHQSILEISKKEGAPPPVPVYDNPNHHLSTSGMLITLGINLGVFVALVGVFEIHRFYKQIYLKRLQKRFEDIGRVPPIPRDFAFGWLYAIFQVTEMDVLRMVGLDAYMLLRYHVVCYKLSLFLSFWGILVLMPIYMTSNVITKEWDRYTLSNVVSGDQESKYRLWAAAVFGYVFAAYFMQLLYAEYNNFSVRRLQYLVQADPDSPQGDPDTAPQKYFTIMVERIPGHLRSAAALYKFFENLFPGEVYNVEIALDLKELNSITRQRQSLRGSLEKAIAYYEATNVRPEVFIQTGKITIFPDETTGLASESNTWASFLQRVVAPEIYGFEKIDSLSYYTNRLVELNKKVDEMQHISFEYARKADKDLARKLKNRHDTRAAEIVQKVKSRTGIFASANGSDKRANSRKTGRRGGSGRGKATQNVPSSEGDGRGSRSSSSRQGSSSSSGNNSVGYFEQMFFGAPVQEYNTIATAEMNKVEVNRSNTGPISQQRDYSYTQGTSSSRNLGARSDTTQPFKGTRGSPVDISTSASWGGSGTANPLHSKSQGRRGSNEITVMRNSTGGYKMRHESIGSQDSDNTSASGELEPDDDMDTSTSPPLQQSRYIRSLSEAMRPENFDLLSGEYHRDKRDKAKEKERLTGIAEGRPMDSDDNNRPMLLSEAVKKAPYAPTVEPAHTSSASASPSATSSHPTPPSPPTAAFTPTLPTPVHTTVPVSAPIVSPVPASIPAPHVPQIPPTSTALPASVPVSVPAPMSSGRPPTVPPHHTPPLVPPVADLLNKGSVTGLTGIAEVSNRAKVSHVPFDGTLPLLGAPDSDPSVAESEDEQSPNEAPYRRKWGSKTDGGDTSDREGSEKGDAISMEGDATLREWMKTAQVNIKEELRLAEQRAEQFAADTCRQKRLAAQGTKVVDINDLLDPTTTSISGLSIPSLPSITMPSIVTRNLQPSVDAFSGDLDQMNLSNHPPSGNMTPKGSSSSSFTTSSTVPPLLSQSSVSNIPFSTTANAPYSAYLTGNAMNSSSHGSAHGSVGGGSVSGSVAGGGAGGGSVRSQGSIPMMGFKQDSNDASRYDDPMRAQGEGMRRGWNDDETGTETESEMDYGPTNGAAGSRLERMGSTMTASMNQTMSNISSQMISPEQLEEANKLAKVGVEQAKLAGKQGWEETKKAGSGALRGIIEVERAFEMLTLGAFYKYSSTAFVTFNSRITESIAQQMLLSHDAMEINHAPNPNDIIWENVSIPKSQVRMRNYITNICLVVGSLFWSTLVTSVNQFSSHANLPQYQQQYLSVIIVLVFLLILPFIFDFLARHYEGMKLESEIQNSIMTRYFYYQLINVYVTVGFGGSNIITQILLILRQPQTLVDILGRTIPSVSLYFVNLVIVKIFTAVPLEMLRPWQLSTILMMGTFMDRRKCTRRELRTGAFYAWPMLYGWVYPQLMMVTMIMVTYSCIAPLLMPFCVLFFAFAYLLYKYQLLYVYINDYQSGGEMWYAVFSRSLIALLFAAFTLLGYLSLELNQTYLAGPFYFLLPLPFSIVYFWHYCEAKFKLPSMNLSFGFAKTLDHRNNERRVAGKMVPHDTFKKDLYRQPALTERGVYPEPYRRDNTYDHLRNDDDDDMEGGARSSSSSLRRPGRPERGSLSLNVHEELDQGEENQRVMEAHFNEVVLPLAAEGPQHPLFASTISTSTASSTHGNAKGPRNRTGRGGGPGHAGRGGGRGDGGAGTRTGAGGVADTEAVENPIHTRPRS